MIYTVTFNPSIDYVLNVPKMELGSVNRSENEEYFPGGKGINVSIMLANLGHKSCALGFTAGFTGRYIKDSLAKIGANTDFIELETGYSRINVKLRSDAESEINGQGPHICESDIQCLFDKLEKLQDGDILVLAGSIPSSMTPVIYEEIMNKLQKRDIKIIVDATGELLKNVLKYKPFLIKPNNHELGELFGATVKTFDDVLTYAQELQKLGAKNVLISMAGDGAVLVDSNGEVHKSLPPDGKVLNSVGAGDSMVAGFLAGFLETEDYSHAFYNGLCAGSASAFSKWLADGDSVKELLKKMKKRSN